MQTLNKTTMLAAALAATTVLLLAGCSTTPRGDGVEEGLSVDGAPVEGDFEFQTPSWGSDEELTIRIPEALLEAAGSDADGVLVGEVTAKARKLDSSKACAVDLAIDYRGDGLDTLGQPSMTKEEYAAQGEDELESVLMREFGVETVEEAESAAPGGAAEVGEIVENLQQAPYSAEPAWSTLEATPVDDLDASDPELGRYISDDSKTLTFVLSCASDPYDDGSTDTFNFPIESDGTIDTFAFVEMTVMKSGTVTIIDSGVTDYESDSNGDWIGA
ncbi:hypothetical protein K2F54_13965 [Cryobacterium sp. 1639]|uniref:hypothetical protein n=1 Tax=Cryobacterium inferilacus TaxID=2866629 RepID=UPI001C72B3AA|nr:hypothetical protein [Cryobacterium sp. 1639]MBX0301078.1 hypothetical protein [Cryobacterium sp. 1639]